MSRRCKMPSERRSKTRAWLQSVWHKRDRCNRLGLALARSSFGQASLIACVMPRRSHGDVRAASQTFMFNLKPFSCCAHRADLRYTVAYVYTATSTLQPLPVSRVSDSDVHGDHAIR